MVFLRTLRSHHIYSLLRHQKSSLSFQTPPHSSPIMHECVSRVFSFSPSSVFHRTFCVTAQSVSSSDVIEEQIESETTHSVEIKEEKKKIEKKPVDVMFKEAVGITEREQESERSCSEDDVDETEKEIHELKKKLRGLEREIRSLKVGDSKITGNKRKTKKTRTARVEEKKEILTVEARPKKLSSLFRTKHKNLDSGLEKKLGSDNKSDVLEAKKLSSIFRTKHYNLYAGLEKNLGSDNISDVSRSKKVHESVVYKPFEELCPELILLVNRLYEDGYLKTANFLPENKLDLSRFSSYYSRAYLTSAAEKFGRDHQEIVQSLSVDDLKRIALFGCPTVWRRTTVAAKRLRAFFSIQEDIVCRPCKLKSSCKFVDQREQLMPDELISDIMAILTLYGLELVPAQLEIPKEIKDSVRRLLKEVVNTSQIESSTRESPNPGV